MLSEVPSCEYIPEPLSKTELKGTSLHQGQITEGLVLIEGKDIQNL